MPWLERILKERPVPEKLDDTYVYIGRRLGRLVTTDISRLHATILVIKLSDSMLVRYCHTTTNEPSYNTPPLLLQSPDNWLYRLSN